jgi:outer membrane protein OmpA-like peptidoglycan-associated protein
MSRSIAVMSALAAAGAFAACAATTNPQLEQAQAAYTVAQADPVVAKDGQVQLYEAKQDLERANHALKNGDDKEIVDHYAYLAQRRVDVARANADREEAKKHVDQLGAQRNAVVLDARTREADRAHERAAMAELDAASVRAELSELQAKDTARGLVITVPNDVLFDVDRAELKPGALAELQRVAEVLKRDPERNVRVEGHADSTGSEAHNLELSKLRADSVGNALILDGVAPARVTTQGFGDAMPVAGNETAAGRQQNRRVEIVVQEPGR